MSLKFLSTHLLVLLLLLPLGGNAQASSSASTPASATDKGRAVYFGESGRFKQVNDIYIPMRDGKSLAADVWLPKAQKRSAAILIMTPYNRKLVGAPLPDPTAELDLPDDSHYAYVLVDWRGFFGSKKAKKFFILYGEIYPEEKTLKKNIIY